MSNPNLQNIPKEEPEGELPLRACFIPDSSEHIFVSMDYSQIEYRVMLDYANDTRLIESVMNGMDLHQATADLVGIPRQQAKTLNFAILYGAGPDKIASMLGLYVTEATRLRTKYFLKLPKVESLIWQIIEKGKARGYVNTWTGRRMRADRGFFYTLPNHLIQSGSADVLKIAMKRCFDFINENMPRSRMTLSIHDQLVFNVHESELGKIAYLKDIMETIYPPRSGIILKVDVSISSKSLAEQDLIKWTQK